MSLSLPVPGGVLDQESLSHGIAEIYPGFIDHLVESIVHPDQAKLSLTTPLNLKKPISGSAFIENIAYWMLFPDGDVKSDDTFPELRSSKHYEQWQQELTLLREQQPQWAQICDLGDMLLHGVQNRPQQAYQIAQGFTDSAPVMAHYAKLMLLKLARHYGRTASPVNHKEVFKVLPFASVYPRPDHGALHDRIQKAAFNYGHVMNGPKNGPYCIRITVDCYITVFYFIEPCRNKQKRWLAYAAIVS